MLYSGRPLTEEERIRQKNQRECEWNMEPIEDVKAVSVVLQHDLWKAELKANQLLVARSHVTTCELHTARSVQRWWSTLGWTNGKSKQSMRKMMLPGRTAMIRMGQSFIGYRVGVPYEVRIPHSSSHQRVKARGLLRVV